MLGIALYIAAASVPNAPRLRSESAVVRFADTGEVLVEKNADVVRPIASVTKLLSGLVVSQTPPDDSLVTIGQEDKDRLKWSKSRLFVGFTAGARTLFSAALAASENRAMYAVVRALGFPRSVFAEKMNSVARGLGMTHSRFVDPAGIDPRNVSTANDLVHLLDAAAENTPVREATLLPSLELQMPHHRPIVLTNPDRLARSSNWNLVIGKTGYTTEAGRSLVARAIIAGRPVDMIFVGAREMASVFGDASRVRQWLTQRLTAEAAAR